MGPSQIFEKLLRAPARSSQFQTPSSKQAPSSKLKKRPARRCPGICVFGVWCLILGTSLELGVWSLGFCLVPHFINTATFATRDFWPRRGASDAHTLQGSVRSEQRRRGQKEPSPGGLRRFSVLASLLLGHSPTSGDAPSSRLARTENRRNKRGRIYETGYLAATQKTEIRSPRIRRFNPGQPAQPAESPLPSRKIARPVRRD